MSIINAASVQQAHVQAAITAAVDGDTVMIPAGTASGATAWTSNITTNKRLIIQGAGSSQTVIYDNRDPTIDPKQILIWNVPADSGAFVSSLSGIKFFGLGYTNPSLANSNATTPTSGIIRINGTALNKRFRVHHMDFNPWGTAALVTTDVMGVVDHCVFHLFTNKGNPGTYTYHPTWGNAGNYGDNSWASASTLGTDQALYFEDNQFLAPVTTDFGGANDDLHGARVVYRHNIYKNQQGAGGHGTESGGRPRGFRHHEVYENDVTYESGTANTVRWSGFRSGTGFMFNNRVVIQPGAALTGVADISADRAGASNHYDFWGRAGGYNVDLTSSGNVVTATLHADEDDGNGHGFNKTQAGLVWVRIVNATDTRYNGIWQVVIPAPFGLVFQFLTPGFSNLPPATAVKNAPWDQNTDGNGYAVLDQPGRGRCTINWNGVFDPTPVQWPGNASEPIYYWNNTIDRSDGNGPVFSPIVGADGAGCLHENRDYFNTPPPGFNTPGGYTPFTYPHPLVAGSSDATPPVVTITGPTANPTFVTNTTPL